MTLKHFSLCILVAAMGFIGNAQTKNQALRDANIAANAFVKGNVDDLLKHTLPSVVSLMGGEESAKNNLERTLSSMEKQGFKVLKSEIISVSDIIQEQNQHRCVVENHIEMITDSQRLFSKSYLLGIYNQKDGFWWFIEAKELQTPQIANQIIPGFKTDLNIPDNDVRFESIDN
jgi:hypothetical protein